MALEEMLLEENFYVYELPKTLASDQSIYRYIKLNLFANIL